ncbi:MAG: STAS domain-containing protein [Tissierellia bacterium]|nr:STAS domain-containing protein [Tissierellia bacterium]
MAFQLTIDEQQDQIVLYPQGELDMYYASDFKEQSLEAYEKAKKDVLIDGGRLDYVDSTGLGGFMYLLKEVREDGHKIFMKDIKDNIRKLFTITQLDAMFTFIEE